jgi:processive 1,2-diacylglycerol beta-glucosyltransferase
MVKIDLVYFDAGGGHRAAATALRDLAVAQRRPWAVRPVQLMQVLDPLDRFRRLSGMAPEDLYNRRLAKGWTFGLGSELRLLQAMIRATHSRLVERLAAHWRTTRPDLVVSLVPNFNRAMAEALARACPGVPFVTVMTDFADHPPNFWIEPGVAQHIVCGTPRAMAQARAAGVPADRIHAAGGMILRRQFYQPSPADREADLGGLGLDPHRPTAIVMFGGQGSAGMVRVARALEDTQLLLLCGHNDVLRQRLATLDRRAPHAAIGFTPDVPRYMRLCDLFIGKPGPGSISEAWHCGLPVVTFRNALTLPQERYNTELLEALGAGVVVPDVKALPAAVGRLLADLPAFQQRVRTIQNRAAFEVLDTLATVLGRSTAHPTAFDAHGGIAA